MLSICFNPLVSAPDTALTAAALDKLEFYAVIDFFLSETAQHADVVLAGSLHEEDEGTTTTGEGRIVKINKAVDPPGEARVDWQILVDLAARLGKGHYFPYTDTEQIFEELRLASAGGTADYRGATWARIVDEMGLFWPIPTEGHPGTPRLFEGGRFFHPDGRAKFHGVAYRPPAEVVDDDYPTWLTTGRVVSQYLSGTQTRRIGGLVEQYPEPLCEMHPLLAEQRRRGGRRPRRGQLAAWCDDPAGPRGQHHPPRHGVHPVPLAGCAGGQPADQPGARSHVEDAGVQGRRGARARRRRARSGRRPAGHRTTGRCEMRYGIDDTPVFVIDQSRCIGCEACLQACMECGTHRGRSMIHLERIDRAATTQTAPMVCMHCEDPTCAQVCPADAIKQNEDGIVQSSLKPRCIGCSNCVLACPFGVPKYDAAIDQMMKCDMCLDRTSEGLKPMCASVCPSEALWYGTLEEFAAQRRGSLLRDFMFGRQEVRTKVYTVVDDVGAGPIDVLGPARTTWLDDPFALGEAY